MKIIGIVQPTYLPWLPFFERMAASDIFIYLDDVEFSKNSWHNRNAIKGRQPARTILTVPVKYRGHSRAAINEIEIDNGRDWRKKHWRTLETCYRKSDFFSRYEPALKRLYAREYRRLIDVQLPFIAWMKEELGISTPCFLASEIDVPGARNEKLVNLCKHFGGTHFIVKPGTESYHPASDFEPFGVQLYSWQPRGAVYSQQHGSFEANLSALDFLMNCGPGQIESLVASTQEKAMI